MGDFDFGVIIQSLPFLGEGMLLSLWLTFLAIIGGIVLGTLLALARLSGIAPLALLAAPYHCCWCCSGSIFWYRWRSDDRSEASIPP